MSKLPALLEERSKVWTRMQEIMRRAENDDRDLTAEERTNWDEAEARVSELSGDIDRRQRMAALGSVDYDQVLDTAAAERSDDVGDEAEKRYGKTFTKFLRRGLDGLASEQRQDMLARYEQRAQSVGTNTAGGYLVPPGFLQRMTEAMKSYGGIMGAAEVMTTDSGNPLQWPSFDGTAQVGQILAENTQETALDLALGQKTLGAYTYSSRIVLASLQLIQDSAFDVDTFVARQCGIRIGRAVAAHLATGDGSSKPTGLFAAPTVGKTGATGQTTSIIFDDLVDLEHSVDPAYRQGGNCTWVLNDATLKVIRKLKDTQGHPLWQPSLMVGVPDTLNGYSYVIDQGVPTMAANAYSLGFGDLREAYIVRQVTGGQLLRMTERYADYLQVGFLGFLRLDAKPNDTGAFKAYQNSAT